jgi:hypothetical protein
MTTAIDNLPVAHRDVVRGRVRALLESSDAYRRLPADERRKMARAMVDTVAYLADPAAGTRDADVTTTALAEPAPAAPNPGSGSGIGDAARAGAQAYKDLTAAVDFPKFVSGLIDGVFNAIVDASIRQMEAYQKLLENVVKSVDQFAKDNFTLNQGRDYLVDRFPNLLQVNSAMGQPRLAPTPEAEDSGLGELTQALGLPSEPDLSDENTEAELARRAQLEMAKLRQKQLATMVLMGINRIVVTNGLINAKVIVDVQTRDTSRDTSTSASSFDEQTATTHRKGGGWFSTEFQNKNVNTVVKSTTEDKSTDTQDVKTKASLTGEVKINFKSETFPLERLASQTDLEAITQVSR